jgi:glycosyltransferase involved in cell wall biosynthesis
MYPERGEKGWLNNMHILMIADGRSPTAHGWVMGVAALQHRVTLVSTYPCQPMAEAEATHILPVAFSALGGSQAGGTGGREDAVGLKRQAVGRGRGWLQTARYWLGPLTLPFYARQLDQIIAEVKPDLVHALRIPFEGMLAATSQSTAPLAVTIWGNDLSLHAGKNPWMRSLTRRTLQRANGLAADVRRDIRMGQAWGFASDRPSLVAPGGGGIDLGEMHRMRQEAAPGLAAELPEGAPLIVNPRGLRPGYVRNDVFFEAIPLILQHHPDVTFACASMAGQAEAEDWVRRMGIEKSVRLLPYLSQPELWQLFNRAAITISVSVHDGTPNTLLEAMACGCFPVVGDLESLREWITPGVNGLLVEPAKPQTLAEAALLALEKPELRARASEINLNLICERAEVGLVRSQMEVFYRRLAP